jgi:hypothetical protein
MAASVGSGAARSVLMRTRSTAGSPAPAPRSWDVGERRRTPQKPGEPGWRRSFSRFFAPTGVRRRRWGISLITGGDARRSRPQAADVSSRGPRPTTGASPFSKTSPHRPWAPRIRRSCRGSRTLTTFTCVNGSNFSARLWLPHRKLQARSRAREVQAWPSRIRRPRCRMRSGRSSRCTSAACGVMSPVVLAVHHRGARRHVRHTGPRQLCGADRRSHGLRRRRRGRGWPADPALGRAAAPVAHAPPPCGASSSCTGRWPDPWSSAATSPPTC